MTDIFNRNVKLSHLTFRKKVKAFCLTLNP